MIERPNDERRFIHKKLLGGISAVSGLVGGFVPGANIVSRVTGQLSGRTVPRTLTARPTVFSASEKEAGRSLKFPESRSFAGGGCEPPNRFIGGRCQSPVPGIRGIGERLFPGGATGFRPDAFGVGDAVMGQFGAALEPGVMTVERSVCLPGMQLAKDGLCYNKGAITNAQRRWPRGRRPLLTGGDMRAIGIAARAGAKLERTTKRLRTLGMMKRLPAPRKALPPAHAHAKPVAAVSV